MSESTPDAGTIEAVVGSLVRAPGLLLLLDYDGTLVEIAGHPDQAVPDPSLIALLRGLAARPATSVHVVSGRPRAALEDWFGDVPVALWAEHGAFVRRPSAAAWRPVADVQAGSLLAADVVPLMAQAVEVAPGSFVESKTASVVWHYRLADPEPAGAAAARLLHALRELSAARAFEVLQGRKALEVRLPGISKALAVQHARAALPNALVVAIGDDQTDDDMFRALGSADISVAVGRRACAAQFRLSGPAAVRALLDRIAESIPHPSSSSLDPNPDRDPNPRSG